jgi:nitrite reductase/ring-hydroxylating ferredoxin subunit
MTDDLKQFLDRAVDWYEPPEHLLDGARDRLDRRRIRRRMSAGVLALVVAVIGGIVAWQAFQPVRESPAVDGGWYRVGHVDELRARRIAYIPELETFVIALPGEGPFALSASSPHQGERLLFCRTSGWFFSPAHGEMFDVHGNYELGPAPSGMIRRPVRVVDGIVEVDGSTDLEPVPRGDGRADPEWSGPPCASDSGAFVEDEPGFASISGDLPQADRFPV